MSFLKNLFSEKTHTKFLEDFLQNLFSSCDLSLHFDIEETEKNRYLIDLYGKDEELLVDDGGKLLHALQVYLSVVMQTQAQVQNKEDRIYITVDSLGFLEQEEKDLMDLASRLKKEALEKNKPVILRHFLNSYQRRKIHQALTEDGKVKTTSIGEGSLKKIRICPTSGSDFNGPQA